MRLTPLFLLMVILAACSPGGGTGPQTEPSLWTEADPAGEGFVTVVEAGDQFSQTRIYFKFNDGGEHFPEAPNSSTDWDLSFRFAWIEINGGISGPAEMELLYLDFEDYGDLLSAPSGDYLTDTTESLAFDAGQGWYHYVQGTEDWEINDRNYVVRAGDGRFYKLKIDNFLDEQGRPGLLKFRWAEIASPR
jgi:hypothetical protein